MVSYAPGWHGGVHSVGVVHSPAQKDSVGHGRHVVSALEEHATEKYVPWAQMLHGFEAVDPAKQ